MDQRLEMAQKKSSHNPPPFPRHQSAAGVVFGHTQAPASKRRRQDTWEVKLAPKRKDKKREKRKKQRELHFHIRSRARGGHHRAASLKPDINSDAGRLHRRYATRRREGRPW